MITYPQPTVGRAMNAPLPSHDEITQYARDLWNEFGCPEGRDEDIWLEAERRLISARRSSNEAAAVPNDTPQKRGRTDRQ